MDGWDGIGMDLRVGGGIEHLTVLIIFTSYKLCLQNQNGGEDFDLEIEFRNCTNSYHVFPEVVDYLLSLNK